MTTLKEHRDPLGQVKYPFEVREALKSVSELPDDLEQQAAFFDMIQELLSARLREEQ